VPDSPNMSLICHSLHGRIDFEMGGSLSVSGAQQLLIAAGGGQHEEHPYRYLCHSLDPPQLKHA